MKKILFIAALAAAMTINAAERGKFIHLDSSVNKNMKPQIAFCQEHKDGKDITYLIVKTVNTNEYNEFSDATRILMRFADGNAVRLNKTAGSEVKKDKHNEKNGRATITKYWTETTYDVPQDVITKLTNNIALIKVRIVYKENDAKDYDIAEGYQEKLTADLFKSYQEAELNNRKSNTDLSDEDF